MSPGTNAPIAFTCDGCGRAIRVAAERAGQAGRCPDCGRGVTVPAAEAPGGNAPQPEGVWDPKKVEHIALRVPYYADRIRRRQARLGQYLTPEEARAFVLRLYHEHTLQVGTLFMIGLLASAVLSLVQDGFGGALVATGWQILWAAPLCGAIYVAGRALLVPPDV